MLSPYPGTISAKFGSKRFTDFGKVISKVWMHERTDTAKDKVLKHLTPFAYQICYKTENHVQERKDCNNK